MRQGVRSRIWRGAALVVVGLLATLAAVAAASGVHLTRLAGWNESEGLVRRLGIRPGMSVADVGAGSGWLAVEVARYVGPGGQVFATELNAGRLNEIREAVRAAGLTNVTVIEAGDRDTGLPAGCCEVIYLRNVYHHIAEPRALGASLYASVAAGGRLGIIDFEPRGLFRLFASDRPNGSGHGVWRANVRDELEQAGFRLVDTEERWGRFGYLLVFRR